VEIPYAYQFSISRTNQDFYSQEQLNVLEKIIKNATEEGKVQRYSTGVNIKRNHPISEIYSQLLTNPPQITEHEFVLIKKDAYKAGCSAATSVSLEEVVSWFYWANGQKYLDNGNKIPVILFKLAQGGAVNQTVEEKKLLEEALLLTNAAQSDQKISSEEFDMLEKHSSITQQQWAKLYFSDKFSTCPSFSDYLEKE
jgi:hypothetical protein